MNIERNKIYLAALMHDIGKFLFRAQEVKSGEGHEMLGEQFIRECLTKIAATKETFEEIVHYSKHHQTEGYCSVADRITSEERINEDSNDVRKPLANIFQNIFKEIRCEDNSRYPIYFKPEQTYYYNPSILQADNVSNSVNKENTETEIIQLHKSLLEEFKKEITLLNTTKHIEALSASLYYLLHKYTARISSASYKAFPDISLFDHNRATAALVNCLTYPLDEKDLKTFNPEKIKYDFILIKGDLSGIQKFIYSDISLDESGSTKKLAKRLRGRSFYVSLLTDFVASLFIRELELEEANILYSGGGHFLILAPSDKNIEEKINKLEEKINLFLRDKLTSRLTLVLGKDSFDKSLFSNAGEAIQKVNYELNKAKYKKHKAYLEEILFNDKQPDDFNEDETIGELLPYGKYLIEITSTNAKRLLKSNNLAACFQPFNSYYFIISEPDRGNAKDALTSFFTDYKDEISAARIFKINDTDFLENASDLCKYYDFPISFGFKYIGNSAPLDEDGNVLSFEEIAELDRNQEAKLSYPQLGILRLDVDNLGAIFGYGLGEKVAFSRIASLSRELHHFFCGYVNKLAREHQIYIAYSGGDDAFFIGSWINIIHFANTFRKEFEKFVCYNPNITFSAGIFICDAHYPVAKFADKAAEMEKMSKRFNNNSKNANTVFDHTLNWKEFDSMLVFAEKLLQHTKTKEGIENEKLARSMVHRLLRIIKASLYSKGEETGRVDIDKLNRNVMHLHYLFARHGFTAAEIENTQEELKKEIIKVILTNFNKKELVKNYLIPTQYVILKTRTKEKTND